MRDLMKLTRTLHIYVSMLGLLALLFFAVTGFTLNHSSWFGLDQPRERKLTGMVDVAALKEPDKLAVVEALRRDLHVSGAASPPDISDEEFIVEFKGPGTSAYVVVNRQTGEAEGTISHYGAMAVLHALHMGRDSGAGWSLLIDITAWLMVFVSVSGLVLLFSLPKRRKMGLAAMAAGLGVCVVVYVFWVP